MVLKYSWLQLSNGYKWTLPLKIGTHKMAEHMTGRNICFLLLTQQVDSESTETTLNKGWAWFFICRLSLLGEGYDSAWYLQQRKIARGNVQLFPNWAVIGVILSRGERKRSLGETGQGLKSKCALYMCYIIFSLDGLETSWTFSLPFEISGWYPPIL